MDWSDIYRRIAADPNDAEAYQAVHTWAKVLVWRTLSDFGPDEIADIVAETCARIYVRFGAAHGPATFCGFAFGQYRLARQGALRRRQSHYWERDVVPVDDSLPATTPGPLAALEREERLDRLRDCLDRLSEREQMAVRLHYLQAARFRSISEALEMKEDSVRKLVQRSRFRLRDCLEGENALEIAEQARRPS